MGRGSPVAGRMRFAAIAVVVAAAIWGTRRERRDPRAHREPGHFERPRVHAGEVRRRRYPDGAARELRRGLTGRRRRRVNGGSGAGVDAQRDVPDGTDHLAGRGQHDGRRPHAHGLCGLRRLRADLRELPGTARHKYRAVRSPVVRSRARPDCGRRRRHRSRDPHHRELPGRSRPAPPDGGPRLSTRL